MASAPPGRWLAVHVIFGTDSSAYQQIGTYDPASFEIVNALDPTLPQKVARNQADGRPWGIYSWVFPGEHGSYTVGRAINALSKTGAALAPLGFWWDYEDNGVVQSQLDQAFATSDAEGYWSGYYGNDYRFDHSTLLNRPYWMAAYPNPNDGVWRDYQATASRPVNLWQWTSTNGTLDQNVVIDEAWYGSLAGGTPPKKDGFLMALTDDEQRQVLQAAAVFNDGTAAFYATLARIEAAVSGGGDGGGLSADAVRAIVRDELDKTKLTG